MAIIDWKPQFETGIAAVDAQHKTLVDALNRLHQAMKEGKGKQEVGDILHFLRDYTVTHFRDEEALLVANGYPDIPRHKALHADLLKQVNEYVAAYDSGSMTLSMKVMDFLQDWLSKHILGEDKRYATHFKEKGLHL